MNTKVIITNKIHYIYKYDKLKYGLFVDSSLTATRYWSFYRLVGAIFLAAVPTV